ncbi:nucleophile aminohydrolase [Pyronema domesticum]|uniref:Similar to Threonine aspartase 1 acc. no. Q9H6P5 n=1 Tax=Pyronema omphalodes (strain CBS 100304) TaxID=1076935 RepID=U4KZ40_PYROM|nr:nucleophile aminohydrolase [Pyronema domesticum]CCX04899.1 Similar to Threonine aspartase 1; acc. no. Q9H6P5 [Pyronema omphalodes CBS 100304]
MSATATTSSADWSCIFVHAGAGYHSQANEALHLDACALACKAAMALLRNGGSAVDGVEMALRTLEDNEITNSGYGSNLSLDGTVECDASIMEESGRSGAVGAVDSFKNPSALARLVLDNSRKPMSLKRVPPILIAGPGARNYAIQYHFPIISNDQLVSYSAHQRWLRWTRDLQALRSSGRSHSRSRSTPRSSSRSRSQARRGSDDGVPTNPPTVRSRSHIRHSSDDPHPPNISKSGTGLTNIPPPVKEDEDHVTDTVGAICVDKWGRVAAGSSSGGIGMKYRGRIGPAALIGIGTWIKTDDEQAVAATCSGTGEQMAHTMIASKAVDRMFGDEDELMGLQKAIEQDFMGSNIVRESSMAAAVGIMAIKLDKTANGKGRIHFIFGHTTDSMALAHQGTLMKEPITTMSRNKRNPKACMGGYPVPVA